jgi:molybdopterin converting factor subunit 1
MTTTGIDVRLFAQARELAGKERITVSSPSPTTAGDLRNLIALACPELKTLLERCRLAVNHRIAEDRTSISQADEVAVIPPVAGG